MNAKKPNPFFVNNNEPENAHRQLPLFEI